MNIYTPQPAYKIYAFDRGWRVLKYVVRHLFLRTQAEAEWWFKKAQGVRHWSIGEDWYKVYAAWVVIVGLWIAGGIQYVTATIVAALFIAAQVTALSLWAAISLIGMGVLSICTFAYSRYYRIFFRCPDCHRDMPIPTYICPTCSAEHSRLWPSIYGVLKHRCKACGTRLPAISAFGRKRLLRICPHCRRPLNVGIGEGTNVHVPIVGGPSTGKTNYIVMATQALKQTYEGKYGYRITFTDDEHQRNFEANLRQLASGQELLKTPDIVPQAINLKIRAPKARVPKLAYVYDAAGEAFNKSENTSLQEYYKYVDGIILIIDPFSIAAYRRLHQKEIERLRGSLRPSALDVMQTYERMMQMFEASVGLRKKRYAQPVAVVITKVDALDLEHDIGLPAAHALVASDPALASEDEAISKLVRDFLCSYDLENFVRDLESQFAKVRYFSCSALGRLPNPGDTSSFDPVRVLEPLAWLLTQSKVLSPVQQPARKQAVMPPLVMQQHR